jgi:hypothetical protein
MSSKKQITIDPSMLGGGGAAHNVTMKRQRKMKPPVALLRPSTVKKNLLEKIKDYKRRNEETAATDQPQPKMTDTDLASQFKTSSNYLEQLMHRKKEGRKAKSPTGRVPATMPATMPIMTMPMPAMTMPATMTMPMPAMTMPMPATMTMPMPAMTEISLELPPELQINPISAWSSEPLLVPTMPAMPPATATATAMPAIAPAQIKNDVPYGCLRNGNKPTYRTYHRKMQPQQVNHATHHNNNNNHNHNNHNHNHTMKLPFVATTPHAPIAPDLDATETAIIQERQRKLRELQEKAATAVTTATAETTPPPQPEHTKIRIKQTITKKYKLGRSPGCNVVGVLIKNNETRRQVQQECGLLKRESIIEVRKYLHDHGLLKVGSDAPPDVLRNMYESAKLTGDVNNVNKNVILHNFMNAPNATA